MLECRFGSLESLLQQTGTLDMQRHHRCTSMTLKTRLEKLDERLYLVAASVQLGQRVLDARGTRTQLQERAIGRDGLVLEPALMRGFGDSKLPASALSRHARHRHHTLGKLDQFFRTTRTLAQHRERLGVTLEIGPAAGCRFQHRNRTGKIGQRVRSLLGDTQTQ